MVVPVRGEDVSPLMWSPFSDGIGFYEQVWNSLSPEQRTALMGLHCGVLTFLAPRRALAERRWPLVMPNLLDLTGRGEELAAWAERTGKWTP
jgi:hypothetical protein